MRSSAHISGHPIHPMLVGFPVAYLLGSACIDVWARAFNRPSWFRTARHLNVLGLGSALLAAIPGLVDYVFAVPPESSARKRATNHMFANLAALGLFMAARTGRGPENAGDDVEPPLWSVAAEVCGSGLMTAAGWMGGTLVFRNQIAVDHRYANAGKWQLEAITPQQDPATDGVDVGAKNDLQVGQMKLLRIGSRRIVIGRTERGYAAFDDRCTHRGGPLSDGSLICGIVQCPWHGSQFDVSRGDVKQGPAEEGIRTYPLTVRNGRLLLHLPTND